jgi:hypothetical protein
MHLRRRRTYTAFSFIAASILALLLFLLVEQCCYYSSSLLLSAVANEDENKSTTASSDDHRSLRLRLNEYNDPKTVTAASRNTGVHDDLSHEQLQGTASSEATYYKLPAVAQHPPPPIQVCGISAPINYNIDVSIHTKYHHSCPLTSSPIPNEEITLIYLGDLPYSPYGQTGNNLIELFHALQYAHTYNNNNNLSGSSNMAIVGIKIYTWPIQLLTMMWMEMPSTTVDAENNDSWVDWKQFVEETLCIRIITTHEELAQYKEIIEMTNTKDLFRLLPQLDTDNVASNSIASATPTTSTTTTTLEEYIEYQCYILRSLYRYYNKGLGYQARRNGRIVPTLNMCSVIDTLFGNENNSNQSNNIQYSVIHSRSEVGNSLKAVSRRSGTDPTASMSMEPEYIKSILRPLNMLTSPIVYIGDKKANPDIIERLLHDVELGPYIILVPPSNTNSWVGGDITLGTLATVFIGNPGSTFSIFIAKSRLALGFSHTYLFRKWEESSGEWVNSCDVWCVFDKRIVNYHS